MKIAEEGDVVARHCSTPGLSGTTDVCVREMSDGTFEARMGISLFGSTNMEWEEIERVNDPFSDEWQDNYCAGKGAAQDDAIKALEKDHAAMFQSIWR